VSSSCACSAAAFKEATRNGGLIDKVPCAVEVETDEVPLLEPQAKSAAAMTPAAKALHDLNIAVPWTVMAGLRPP
jgi:hypothetical protein